MQSSYTEEAVDNTDFLKTAAIILVSVDHVGYFFIENADWWNAFGRLAAPPFFFLMGYANSRTVPLHWILLGCVLTIFDSWNNQWSWVPLNILFSFVLIRFARPYVKTFAERFGWLALLVLVCGLIAVQSPTLELIDYGSVGWLWALFGMYQRLYVDTTLINLKGDSIAHTSGPTSSTSERFGYMRIVVSLATAVIYVRQEQTEFSFPETHLVVLCFAVGLSALLLCLFRRGPSRVQPGEPISGVLQFVGRHTLHIYAIQLAGFEIVVLMFPGLSP